MTLESLLELAEQAEFSHYGPLNVAALEFRPEVREMCAVDKCRSYGRSWTCPPHCGTLEEMAARAQGYPMGILVQSTAELEDDFDIETMMDTERVHKERFVRLCEAVRGQTARCLPMAAGTCTICAQCTCPDAPCRFPDRAIPSMEACGLVVSQVCESSGLPYYYGPQTLTYTSCILAE